MNKIAIIPARGGSKRIPKKNIKPFLGCPIIVYAINVALESGLFNEVMVSTNDDEIANIAIKYGAKVPFKRSEKNSNDYSSTFVVIKEVIDWYRLNNVQYDFFCCIYPTAPFVTVEMLNRAFNLLVENDYDSVFPVVPFSYPVQRGLILSSAKIKMMWPEHRHSRSQDLQTVYHDAGQFYTGRTNRILQKSSLWTDNTGAILLSELEAHDIDNETDWELAELKYRLIKNKT